MRLLWKEWQQQKWIIFWGFLAGISFPVVEYFYIRKDSLSFRTDAGTVALVLGGAIFAIILAIATTHHDIRKGVDSFWQSKPVKPWKLFTVKFVLAAILLYIVFLAVIMLDLITHFRRDHDFSFAWPVLCYTWPMALLLFALSMFLVVVTRDAAKAAFLGMWGGLLIYFLPLMFRGLQWVNILERLDDSQQPSVVQYVIWLCSLSEKFNPGKVMYRPAGIPAEVYQMSAFHVFLQIVRSPAYLQYLFFVAVFGVASVVCIILSIKAMRHNWRWNLGQKSIVWTAGISLAAIFGFAMAQVGHNLEPVKEFNGKQLVNPVSYDWDSMPASFTDGLSVDTPIHCSEDYYREDAGSLCVRNDLMFRVSTGYQWKKPVDERDKELIYHFVLQVYQFPYTEIEKISTDNYVVGAVRFFQTQPAPRYSRQAVFGCFTRGDRLYAAYRPRHIKGDCDKNYLPGSLNPIYFVTFDISDPSFPKVVSNIEISNSDYSGEGMINIDNYCYIADGSRLIILSVEKPDKPEIVCKITYEDAFLNRPTIWVGGTKKMEIFPSGQLLIQGNKLICWNQGRVTIFNINDRLHPCVVYDDLFYDKDYIYKRSIEEFVFNNDTLYIGTKDGIFVLALKPDEDGSYTSRLIGQRMTTPLEKLAGRYPGELLLSGNYLIEAAGGFGVLMYDVSEPTRPRRVYHAQVGNFASDIGFWNGLLFMQEYGFKTSFYQLP